MVWALDRSGRGRIADPEILANEDDEAWAPGSALRCVYCAAVITGTNRRITADDAHEHTFTNPAGIIYHIGCFSSAPGCRCTGELTGEHTWFAGYSWRYASCRGCSAHLGWVFRSLVADEFYGLILDRLEEGEVQ